MDNSDAPPYFPYFLLKAWQSDIYLTNSLDDQRFHIYDVHTNDLSETRRIPYQPRPIFEDFSNKEVLDEHCRTALNSAELAYSRLEAKAELAFEHLMDNIRVKQDRSKATTIQVEKHELDSLKRLFIFLRYRNSSQYSFMLSNLVQTVTWESGKGTGVLLSVWHQLRRHRALTSIFTFLRHESHQTPVASAITEDMIPWCWNILDAEVLLGVASEGQEFVLTDQCTGNLDENFRGDPDSCRFFVPLSPTVALYILGELPKSRSHLVYEPSGHQEKLTKVPVDCAIDQVSDVHLRNTVLLQNQPRSIYFSSLLSITRTINLYQVGSRGAAEHSDYSRLMHRCQQKATQEAVTKTLVVKGRYSVTDLTDQVVRTGNSPVARGSFSDVWKGVWTISQPFKKTQCRTVALKFLRQVMPEIAREKLVYLLKDEIVAWHALRHENIVQLLGVIQSHDTIAMISPWCDNGSLTDYLKEVNPSADRLDLLIQVAQGVSYLHNFRPIVVHGDLKGCNILIDDHGRALIGDFGLAKIIEDFTDSMQLANSFFAGSTRWMAPELILALVEDDGCVPPITPQSDVYSFACVCLEIASGEVPFPHRSNDHAVTVDIMRGVKPSRGSSYLLQCSDPDVFWQLLDHCWDAASYIRPTMSEVTSRLLEQIGQREEAKHHPYVSTSVCDGKSAVSITTYSERKRKSNSEEDNSSATIQEPAKRAQLICSKPRAVS